ncbi:MAG: hypothetical protein R6X33_04100 [Candidatus Brocadiia bacterium]
MASQTRRRRALTVLLYALIAPVVLFVSWEVVGAVRWFFLPEGLQDDVHRWRRARVLRWAGPMADDLFRGLQRNDRATYSRHFPPEHRTDAHADHFLWDREFIVRAFGNCVSREVTKVESVGGDFLVTYAVRFEEEADVPVLVGFRRHGREWLIERVDYDYPEKRWFTDIPIGYGGPDPPPPQ